MKELSIDDCKKLSSKILENVYKPANTFKTTLFLCGAALGQKDKVRYKLADAFTRDIWYSWEYDIIYPEDIFEELLFSAKGQDLLSLENLLADSVDVVLIIPESPGSFAELGAFANNEKLRGKIVCLLDEKYRKDKSFINQGPVKLIKSANKEGIVYIDSKLPDASVQKINNAIRKVKKASSKLTDQINLLQFPNFLLPTIFLLEPVSKDTLVEIGKFSYENDSNLAYQVITTALTIMAKKRQIELTPSGYRLTSLGTQQFFNLIKSPDRNKNKKQTFALDNMRLEVLNLQLRKKSLKV